MNDHRSPTGLTESDVRTHLDPAVMDGLLNAIVDSHVPAPARRSHRKAWALSAGAVLALGSTAAIAAGTLSPQQRESGVFDCNLAGLPGGTAGGRVIGAVTGDPVVDCAAEYRRVSGRTAPPMTAYSSGTGGIEVLPARVTPPAGYQALPGNATLDVEKTLLDETLGDAVAGLNTACLDQAQAVTRSEQIVGALGYADWRVVVDTGSQADATCWVAGARGSHKTVRVARLGGADPQSDTQLRASPSPYARRQPAAGTARPPLHRSVTPRPPRASSRALSRSAPSTTRPHAAAPSTSRPAATSSPSSGDRPPDPHPESEGPRPDGRGPLRVIALSRATAPTTAKLECSWSRIEQR
jgi:hypothetical protein